MALFGPQVSKVFPSSLNFVLSQTSSHILKQKEYFQFQFWASEVLLISWLEQLS